MLFLHRFRRTCTSRPLAPQRRNLFSFGRVDMGRKENLGDKGIIVHPDEGKHSATIVLMHGLGDSADGWIDIAEQFHQQLPWVKFIVPSAASRPITMNGGFQMPGWYDIVGLDDRAGESCEGIEDSITLVRDLMSAENKLGIPYDRMMLAGFSQGGAMSLFAGLQLPIEEKLAGLLVMSGYCPGYSKFNLTPGMEDVPVLHCHGTSDPVVKHEWAVKTKAFMIEQGVTNYTLKDYPGLAHAVNPDELGHALAYLMKTVPDAPEMAIKPKDPSEMSVKELKQAIVSAGIGSQAKGFSEKREFIELLQSHRAKNA